MAFRAVALAYALAVLLIAPTWLAAGEPPPAPGEVPAASAPDAAPPVEPPTAHEQAVQPDAAPAGGAEADSGGTADDAPEAMAQEEAPAPEREAGVEKPVAQAAASGSVTIKDFAFAPKTITVNVGDSVTWTNQDEAQHTATAEDGSFDTGLLSEGQSGSHTFTQAGTIAYICTPHPFMKASVVVKGQSSGGGGGPDTGGGSTGGGDDAGEEAAAEGDSAGNGPRLPATGSETLLIALLGAATLGAGLLLRRRAAP